MTKDISRRSSVSGSAHASLPPTNGTDSPLQDPQQSSEPSLAARRSPSPVRDAPKSTDSDAPSVIAAESQPMTASNSTSSSPAPNNFTTGASATGAVPYGTRSRNRTGGARPNYAEDKEIDMDFEVAPAAKEPNGRKPARGADQSPSSQTETGRATSSVRRAGIDTSQSVTVQNHYKEQIPGTSTFSANLTSATIASQPSTKKRKAGSASQSQTHTPTHGYSTDSSTRRRGIPAHAVMEYRESNMLSFENCGARLKDKKLIADDGTVLEANDHIYLVCEPPGEPYYLGRIMEFLHTNNDKSEPIDSIRLNWYYRPKDIGRKVNDTRQVFASMHSDISPLTSVRGKCQIRHKSEVDSVDELKGMPDCFWYEKLYDRYIHRYYDVIPTSRVINVPSEVKKVLDERWKFIVVEPVRGKELTSAVKSCKRCSKYCANNDSVDCAVCRSTYHMSCVNPPLLKKPSRGFAWACGPCSKAQEKKLEARNTPNASDAAADAEDDDFLDEEDDFVGPLGDSLETGQTSPNRSPEPELTIHPGIHCRVEDALDYDDRIYPRASSRLGPRHQANVMPWPGRPVEYVKATEVKRKYGKGGYQKKEIKPAKETVPVSDTENGSREERPKWVMDAPPGYISRGEDYPNHDPKNTAQLLFNLDGDRTENVVAEGNDSGSAAPKISSSEELHDYMERVKGLAKPLGLPELSTNLQDIGLELLHSNAYNAEAALKAVSTSDKSIFKEPEFTPAELKRFEEGVAKYGSEWHSIKTHVRCQEAWKIVRFYYTWKKTERGKQIWGNYSGRKGKKEAKKSELSEGKLQDDVADEHDDSAFDNDKALERKKGFQCKFCATQSSRVWRRAPNTPAGTLVTENSNGKTAVKEKAPQLLVSLCWRCAELWRRYAVQWEEVEEMKKKVQQPGRAFKRKIDEEIIKEIQAANEAMGQTNSGPSGSISANGTPAPAISSASLGTEPPRKKLKSAPDKDAETQDSSVAGTAGQQRKKALAEKPNSAPPVPEPPKPRLLPCAVCGDMDPVGDRLSCRDCRMTVHRNCYGISENRSPSKWICDMCSNDKNPLLAIRYKCALCPVIYTEQDFVEPPKNSSKKKNEKDRERDRIERESAQRAADFFKQKQADMNKPTNPREPLKRTTGNNWVHVTCAVFTPEIKFGRADALAPSEGFQTINPTRFDEVCALCNTKTGACVSCHSCRATVHVECAHQAGYVLGFDIIPVKGSRREQFNIVTINGETGTMTAAIWCKEHAPTKTIIHRMNDIVDDTGLNVLQLYVRNFKQADLTQTGTMRKAALVYQSAKAANPPASNLPSHRRTSTAATINGSSLPSRGSVSHIKIDEPLDETIPLATNEIERTCVTCGIDVSPKWWPCPPVIIPGLPNGDHHTYGHELILPGVATSESGTGHVALAAAALHQNGHNSVPNSSNFQCHQCHWKKMRKEPTPAPAALPPREESRLSIPPPVSGAAMTDANISSAVPPYGWSPQPSYPPNGPYNNWTHHSPVPPTAAPVHQLNGHHSPHASAGPPISGQPPFRQPSQQAQLVQPVPPIQAIPPVQIVQPGQQIQPVQPLLRSPHQNGQMVQPINGYPPSPHRGMSSSSHHMQNGPYASFASTQPPPQHLTNGGPPPRAPEHPFSQSTAHTHPRPPFALPPHGSPPVQREPNPQGREAGNQQNGARPNDGRVNGGASASPSLRNLLS